MQYTRKLKVHLTDAEFEMRVKEAVATSQRKHEVESDKKSAMAEYKAQIADLDSQLGRLMNVLRDREEDRDVLCDEIPDRERKVTNIVRLDTGEIVETRSLALFDTAEETGKNEPEEDDDEVPEDPDAEVNSRLQEAADEDRENGVAPEPTIDDLAHMSPAFDDGPAHVPDDFFEGENDAPLLPSTKKRVKKQEVAS